jgi:hypothetical protein
MKSLLLYSKKELQNIHRIDNLIRLGLLILAIGLAINQYGLYPTLLTIFIVYSAASLSSAMYLGKEIFDLNNLRIGISIERGRFLYHLISMVFILSVMFYLNNKTVYIFTATLIGIIYFSVGVFKLSKRFN